MAAFLIPSLGLHNDETLFANGLYAPITVADSLTTPWGRAPTMLVSYTGSLKTWLYAPIFWFFEPSAWSIRLPVALLGAAAAALFTHRLTRTAGRSAGLVAAALLATDPVFLLTICFDWGPVALQVFLVVAAACSFLEHARSGHKRWALLGGFLAGLALWNKALVLWNVAGLAVATALVYRREAQRLLTLPAVSAAAAGAVAGAWPLLLYNWRTAGATFTQNAGFELTWPYALYKLRVLAETLDASALFSYMLAPADLASAPATPLAALFFALTIAAIAVPSLRRDRRLVWAIVGFWASYLPMFFGRGVGVGSHHVALLWPLPHLALALASVRLAGGADARRLAAIATVGFVLLFNLRFAAELRAASERRGPAVLWTHAIDRLHDRVSQLQPSGVVLLDWGMFAQLRALGQGRLPLIWGAGPFLGNQPQLQQTAFTESLLAAPGYLFVDHVEGKHVFPGVRQKFDRWLRQSGRVQVGSEIVRDGAGRPVFELFWIASPFDSESSLFPVEKGCQVGDLPGRQLWPARDRLDVCGD